MPRAENRKKPTGQAGGRNQGGHSTKQSMGSSNVAFGQAQSKKQALIEKMKKQVAEKNSES